MLAGSPWGQGPLDPTSPFRKALPSSSQRVTTWSQASLLPPPERAAFAVTSRLLASIVTESLLHAYYVPLHSDEACGACVILSTHVMGAHPVLTRSLRPADVFAIIPLHQEPVFGGVSTPHGRPIWLLDPLDMLPFIFGLSARGSESDPISTLEASILSCLAPPPWQLEEFSVLSQNWDPLHWWRKFAANVIISNDVDTTLTDELKSSYIWQRAVYENPPASPTLFSPAIEWEQSIVEGHPTHPMHRARHAVHPLPHHDPQSRDWNKPWIRFAVVPRARLDILGPFESEIRAITEVASRTAGRPFPEQDGFVVVPVYDLQIANLRAKFPDVEILDEAFTVCALGQASIRTVVFPEIQDVALKLSVGIRISSALRTISHFTANLGPRFSTEVVPKLAIDPQVLCIEQETASAICVRNGQGVALDPDIAKHLTAVIRKQFVPEDDEAVVMCAALLEAGHSDLPGGIPVVEHVMGLDTQEKRLAFFDEYASLLTAAVVPALLHNGVAFEAHPQNTLLRVSRSSRTLKGFVLRDLGGLRVHPPTLKASTGSQFEFLPDHCVVTSTREEAAKKLYHTLIHNHLQRLARVLRLHSDGSAWVVVRKHLNREIPRESWLWAAWMDEAVESLPGKCLVRMKLEGVYRDSVYESFPNMVHFRPAVGGTEK
ncbi:IucC family-domain-containing protein [Gloeopeniophorella convolvens]|nr:IucC family-domain-containing protein [Gloeopeniophorella convolvens]